MLYVYVDILYNNGAHVNSGTLLFGILKSGHLDFTSILF